MSTITIKDIALYTSLVVGNATENEEAIKFMEGTDVPYANLNYNDLEQTQLVLDALNTWWQKDTPPLTGYPFIVYNEYDDANPNKPVSKYVYGIEEIKKFPELFSQYPKVV